MTKITIKKRPSDWIAYDDRMWECGKTDMEALGKLIVSRCEGLKIEIDRKPSVWDGCFLNNTELCVGPMKAKTVKAGTAVEAVKIVRAALCAG